MLHPEMLTWLASPLAIHADWLRSYLDAMRLDARPTIARESRRPEQQKEVAPATVAIYSICGPLCEREGELTDYWGFVSYERIAQTIQMLGVNKAVRAIVLNWNSPGGSALGGVEALQSIEAIGAHKPIVSVSNSMLASAAYHLASASREIVAGPRSLTGSIGTYMLHVDYSKMLDDAGIKPTFIFAGKHKVDGNAYEPLSDEAKAHEQEIVDTLYEGFVADVAKGRKTTPEKVRSGYGQGRVLTAEASVESGLADRVATLGQVVSALSGRHRALASVEARLAELA